MNALANDLPRGSLLTPEWAPSAHGFHVFQRTEPIGAGLSWEEASHRLLTWGVKTASGFRVDSAAEVQAGDRLTVTAGIIREPVEVTEVVREPHRVGFSYRTLPGHPVRGEEAFVLTHDDGIHLTIRSLTAPSDVAVWRLAFPLLRVVQRVVRRRYFRALR